MKTLNLILVTLMLTASSNIYPQWQQTMHTPMGSGITGLAVTQTGSIIATTGSYSWPTGQMGGIRRSIDNGNTWTNPMTCYTARTLHLSQDYLYASYWNYPQDEAIFRSTNDGLNWYYLNYSVPTGNNIFSIADKDNHNTIFLGTRNGIVKSSNSGIGWVPVNSGIPAGSWVTDIAISYSGVVAAATTNGVVVSTNNGVSWQMPSGMQSGDTVKKVCFHIIGGNEVLYAGSALGNIYSSSPSGGYSIFSLLCQLQLAQIVHMIEIYENSQRTLLLAALPKHTDNSDSGPGIYESTNDGNTWTQINDGITHAPNVSILAAVNHGNGNYSVYAGLFENTNGGAEIYKRDFIIGIQPVSNQIPAKFALSQNYPNPFNPTTNIEFSVPKASHIKLVIYDILGHEVETLVDGELKAGTYKTDWNASRYSSGVYFYKLVTNGFTETKKMILTK